MVSSSTLPVVEPDDTVFDFLNDVGNHTDNTNEEVKAATIFNLSSITLNKDDIDLLSNGLKFTPTPMSFDNVEFEADKENLTTKIKKQFCPFNNNRNKPQPGDCIVKASYTKSSGSYSKDPHIINLCRQMMNVKLKTKEKIQRNMNKGMYGAMKRLSTSDIVIKEADKGSAVVLMDQVYYDDMISRILHDHNTYNETADINCTTLVCKVKKFTNTWKSVFTKYEIDNVIKHASRLATIYGLPKIHKSAILTEAANNNTNSQVIIVRSPNDLKFRPIISCKMCPTSKLCEALNSLLQPFATKIHHKLRDTWDFLNKCPTEVEDDSYWITADITSLYTNITTDKCCEAISYFWDKYASDVLPSSMITRFTKAFVIDLFKFCQENLYFAFQSTVFRQISGTGMGRIYAPAAADIKVGYQEVQLDSFIQTNLSDTAYNLFRSYFFRFLDDVIFIWRTSIPGLESIKTEMNCIDPNIKFIFESSEDSHLPNGAIPFLDVLIWREGKTVCTDIYSKPTDTYNYLPFTSSHPRHCCRNIPYSLARRIKGIVSVDSQLQIRMTEMKQRLVNKGYPRILIDNSIERALAIPRKDIINPPPKTTQPLNGTEKNVFFVSTFNDTTNNPGSAIRSLVSVFNSNWSTDSSNSPPKLKVTPSYRKSPSLKDILMFKRDNREREVKKCGKNCIFCDYIQEGTSITLKNGIVVTPNDDFECTSRNVLYIAICDNCREFYLGETMDALNIRWTIHRQQSKLEPNEAPVHADVHFRLCGNNKYTVFPFFRPRKNDVALRRKYENHFKAKFQPKLNGVLYR